MKNYALTFYKLGAQYQALGYDDKHGLFELYYSKEGKWTEFPEIGTLQRAVLNGMVEEVPQSEIPAPLPPEYPQDETTGKP